MRSRSASTIGLGLLRTRGRGKARSWATDRLPMPERYWRCTSHSGMSYAERVRIVAKRTLRTYWERERGAEQPLRSWYAIAAKADWSSPADVKAIYGNASIVGGDRVVFNIGGNRFRLIVRFDYARRIGFVRFVGTHAEYDRIDAASV